jgi:hypothetical protein
MIAQRFRPLGWVAGVATAATALYLVSLQVAVERGKLEAVERQIASAQRELRQLQTELGTRASLRQLEAWNGEVLALSAPKANQFVRSAAQLSAFNLKLSPDGVVPAAVLAVATPVDTAPQTVAVRAKPVPAAPKPVIRKAADPARDVITRTAAASPAKLVPPVKRVRVQRVAMLDTRGVSGTLDRVIAGARQPRP